ncbi:MAG: tyrosine-type recombinase/integrase [Planctomycetota bacterium]
MTFQDTFQAYMLQLAADGRSGHTINQYRRHLARFANWLDETNRPTEIHDIDHQDLAAFLASESATHDAAGKKKRPTSINTIRSSLKTFFCFVHAAGYAPRNAGRLIRRAICGDPPPRAMSESEELRFKKALKDHPCKRDRVLFRLMLQTGIRIGSALGLDIEDLDFENGRIWLRTMKGARVDAKGIPEPVSNEVSGYVDGQGRGAVFQGRDGRRLSARHAQRVFSRIVEKAGLGDWITPHCLRHTYATRLYEASNDLILVKEAMTHRSISSTVVYLSSVQTVRSSCILVG